MYQFILLIHVFAAICLIGLVLVQQGKGATMGAAFGSGASQTVFGSRGSGSFLFRLTLTFVAIFFITSLSLNYLGVHAYKMRESTLPDSILQNIAKSAAQNKAAADQAAATAPMPDAANLPAPALPIPMRK